MKAISLAANPRTLTKTTGSKKVRQGGGLPGVVYGNGDPEIVELEAKQFDKAVQSTEAKNFLVELKIGAKKNMALVQDIQKHPLTNQYIHVDFTYMKTHWNIIFWKSFYSVLILDNFKIQWFPTS